MVKRIELKQLGNVELKEKLEYKVIETRNVTTHHVGEILDRREVKSLIMKQPFIDIKIK